MSDELPFPHHTFSDQPTVGRFKLVSSHDATAVVAPTSLDITGIPEKLISANVAQIMLVHGTFAGNDIIGLMRMMSRVSPRLSSAIEVQGKQWFDQVVSENGNYTSGYADCLSQMVNLESQQTAVTRFHWSGENHHLGRACGVVSLLDTIFSREWNKNDRLLLLVHSHGGNLLAMMTLLLGSSRETKEAFFHAVRSHRRASQGRGQADWDRVRACLMDADRSMTWPKFDIATFGAPHFALPMEFQHL